jgi:hypothetical protein
LRQVLLIASVLLSLTFTGTAQDPYKVMDWKTETIKSYIEITQRPMDKDWYSFVVPGIMNYFDLPDLVAIRSDLIVKYAVQKIDGYGK